MLMCYFSIIDQIFVINVGISDDFSVNFQADSHV